jgi:hypothetical protein
MPAELQNLLNAFPGITLSRMEKLSLQNRTDTKFLLPSGLLPEILQNLIPGYAILDVDGMRINRYETHYLDTPSLQFYRDHHNGKLNRYKIRFRKYPDNKLCFLEIKFKNNKGRTLKTRIPVKSETDLIQGAEASFLESHTPLVAATLSYQASILFRRITLISNHSTERLTFDTGLEFYNSNSRYHPPPLLVAELKQDKPGPSDFSSLMRRLHIRESSISKYCYAMLQLLPELKHNNFKPALLQINRLNHANTYLAP